MCEVYLINEFVVFLEENQYDHNHRKKYGFVNNNNFFLERKS